ncbi:MAG: HNH endonuclease [Candidatus Odinarchaeota archaeon]
MIERDEESVRRMLEIAREIEKRMEGYRLWSNMIPKETWNENLRKYLSRKEWDDIRKKVYERQGYKCSICQKKTQLHCHERWSFDYENGLQTLEGLMGLCFLCHMTNHLGYSTSVLIPEGKLTRDDLVGHWMNVNGKSEREFEIHAKMAFDLWKIRSRMKWTVKDRNGNTIDEDYEDWMKNIP